MISRASSPPGGVSLGRFFHADQILRLRPIHPAGRTTRSPPNRDLAPKAARQPTRRTHRSPAAASTPPPDRLARAISCANPGLATKVPNFCRTPLASHPRLLAEHATAFATARSAAADSHRAPTPRDTSRDGGTGVASTRASAQFAPAAIEPRASRRLAKLTSASGQRYRRATATGDRRVAAIGESQRSRTHKGSTAIADPADQKTSVNIRSRLVTSVSARSALV